MDQDRAHHPGAGSPQEQPVAESEKNAPIVVLIENRLTKEETLSPSTDNKLGCVSTSTWSTRASDNITHLPRPGRRSLWRQWLLEILFCIASLCSFTIIVAVLGAYNNRALPKLPMNITLNTFLAFFTTFTKAAFMTPISEALSQWKWNLFSTTGPHSQHRSLADFEVLDGASRGTWGSWLLVRNFKWRHFVSVAAIFSILSIFTSPITQQMIAYTPRLAPATGEATIPYTRNYAPNSAQASPDVTRASFAGMSSSIDNPVLPISAACSSVNCTFATYSSLAVCMKMKDISDLLTVTEIKNSSSPDWTGGENRMVAVYSGNGTTAWNATLPNGIGYVTPLSYAMLVAGSDKGIAFDKDPNDNFTAIAHLFSIYSNAGNVSYPGYNESSDAAPWPFVALEILYYMCVNTYETSFASGNSTTRIISSSNVPLDVPGNRAVYDANCTLDVDMSLNTCNYGDHLGGVSKLQDPAFPDDRSKYYAIDRKIGMILTHETYFDLMNSFMGDGVDGHMASWTKQNYLSLRTAAYGPLLQLRDTARQFENLGVYFNSTATALSNLIRTGSHDSVLLSGVAWSDETFVSIRWGWAAFLAAQMVLSYLFLAATIYRTAKLGTPVLKSSELATLLAPTDEVRAAVGSVEGLEDAAERARRVRVRLEGGRLVLV